MHVLPSSSSTCSYSKLWRCCSFSYWKYYKLIVLSDRSWKWIHLKELSMGDILSELFRMNSFWRPVLGVSMHLYWVRNNIQLKEGLKYLKFPAGYYMFQVNNRNTTARCKICSKLTIETLEQRIGFTSLNFINNVHENSLNFSV